MSDFFPDRPVSPGPSPDLAALGGPEVPGPESRERGPYAALFAEVFHDAYSTPADLARGARVQADVEVEARTFGDVWTVQSLAAERFGAAAQPQFNNWLANSLQTDAGEQAVLHARKDGAATPGLGNDLVVLHDREAAVGFGHVGVLIGDDSTGWRLYSKDGSAGRNPASGPATWTSTDGTGQSSGPLYKEYRTLDAFFRDDRMSDKYEAAVRFEVAGDDTPGGDRARAAVEAIIREPYHLTRSSCATAVVAALEGAGVGSLSVTRSRATANPFDGDAREDVRRALIYPADVVRDARRADQQPDAESVARREWAARTHRSEPGRN